MCLGNIIPFRSMIQRMSENPDSHHECMPFTEVFKLLLKTSQEIDVYASTLEKQLANYALKPKCIFNVAIAIDFNQKNVIKPISSYKYCLKLIPDFAQNLL